MHLQKQIILFISPVHNFADKRWNEKVKNEIVSSRVDSAKLIIESLKTIPNKVKTVISASGISWYGADDIKISKPFTETDPPANDFMATNMQTMGSRN